MHTERAVCGEFVSIAGCLNRRNGNGFAALPFGKDEDEGTTSSRRGFTPAIVGIHIPIPFHVAKWSDTKSKYLCVSFQQMYLCTLGRHEPFLPPPSPPHLSCLPPFLPFYETGRKDRVKEGEMD